jgi:hypothetical protein
MKIQQNIHIIFGLILVVLVGTMLFSMKESGVENKSETEDVSNLFSPTPQVSTSYGSVSPRPVSSLKPKGEVVIQELPSYQALAKEFDRTNRWLVLDKDCSSIVPSQVDYSNNTQIMLDNTASTKARVLKIGGRQYSLEAGSWILATLSSPTLPMDLPIFCENIELGKLTLVGPR